jgi:hypothetical protein
MWAAHVVQVVMAMYQSRDDAQRRQINAFMTAFQEHPQSWTRVRILSHRDGPIRIIDT